MEGVSPQRTDKPPSRPNAPAGGDGSPQPGAPTGGQSWRWLWGVAGHRDRGHPAGRRHDQDHQRQVDHLHQVHAGRDVQAGLDGPDLQLQRRDHRQAQGRARATRSRARARRCPTTSPTMRNDGVQVSFPTPSSNLLTALLPYLFIIGIGAAFIYFIGRQTRGQMSGIMSIGRSKAKTFSSDRPSTTFDDVAGYTGVKQEISEVVDFLKTPGPLQGDRGEDPQGRPAGRPARHRQDADRPGRRRRGRRALHVGERLGLHGDVRGRRRQPGPRPVPDGPQAGAGHRLRRRDRLHRPQARRRPRRRPRRARADPQPDALGDGRLRHRRGRRDDRRHQPARHPRPGAAAAGPLRPPDRRAAARPRGAAPHPPGALQGQAHGDRRRPQRRGARARPA